MAAVVGEDSPGRALLAKVELGRWEAQAAGHDARSFESRIGGLGLGREREEGSGPELAELGGDGERCREIVDLVDPLEPGREGREASLLDALDVEAGSMEVPDGPGERVAARIAPCRVDQ